MVAGSARPSWHDRHEKPPAAENRRRARRYSHRQELKRRLPRARTLPAWLPHRPYRLPAPAANKATASAHVTRACGQQDIRYDIPHLMTLGTILRYGW
jgi:hypothetical protein